MRYEKIKPTAAKLDGIVIEADEINGQVKRVHLRDTEGGYVMIDCSDYVGMSLNVPAPPPTVKRWRVGEASKGNVTVPARDFVSKYDADAYRDSLIDGCGFCSAHVPEADEVEVPEQ